MTPTFLRRGRLATAALGLLTLTMVPALTQLPAVGSPAAPLAASDPAASTPEAVTPGDPVPGLDDLDLVGTALPSATQRSAATALGDVRLRWNALGTPGSLLPADGSLGAAPGDPVDAARSWLSAHADLFGLSAAQLGDLELVNNQELANSDARAVLFRQRFGGLAPASGSMVTVGVADGQIAYVSSSLTKTTEAPPAATLSPLEGWLKAAANVGRVVPDGVVADIVSSVSDGWTRLQVPGFAQQQTVRLRALALADGSVRPVIEAHVLDTESGAAFGYSVLVDAVDGSVLVRRNQVDNAMYNNVFQGTVTGTACGPMHEFQLTDGDTRSINAVALALPSDDLSIKFFGPGDVLLGTYDLLTSPEVATYSSASIPAGIYKAQVCPFDGASVTVGTYALLVSTSNVAAPGTGDLTLNPKWRYFTANPDLPSTAVGTPVTNSVVGCWRAGAGCTTPNGPLGNIANSGPWDVVAGVPTMTTIGNNANTHEAWANPLAPGGLAQAPVSPTREYTGAFTDAWNESGCNPSQLVATGNDIDASVGNLFVSHNRMHDYSYYLGFTEDNYNMQLDNRGHGGVAGDPEIGNAQAGAIGGVQTGMGRDNANQITLNDGVPGITNQYLFQPLPGAFYAPCTDGGLDMSIVGHEYTHAISNRMIGGPDEGITSEQGGAMGESWGDLNAAEYMFANDYSTGTSPWAVGPYATGNPQVGIRNYAIDQNPLNYSDYGFDSTGVEVHADGEIWNGTMWEVRQALVQKWNAQFPYADKALQKKCVVATEVSSPLPAEACPGNRRWIQLVFDSFLLQQGATSMLDARDTMIAADQLRFGGANKDVLWAAFARRGMGANAATPDADSGDPTPGFSTPSGPNQPVTFRTSGAGSIYVGDYEARATPVADTVGATALGDSATFTPGTYPMLYVSADRGFQRFTLTVPPTTAPQVVTIDDSGVNVASQAAGGSVIGATAQSVNTETLIDGSEATNWGVATPDVNVDQSTPYVAVDLAGGTRTVKRVQVSSMLSPAAEGAEDADSGSRFTALRKFALEACTADCGGAGATWTRFYTSPDDAFPSQAPRPVAPTLTMRSFDVPDTAAAAVRLVALQNQCTGNPAYAGEQDNDPMNTTDCKTGSDRGTIVHAAELQVFDTAAPAAPVTTSAAAGPAKKTKTRLKLTRNRQLRAGGRTAKLKISVISSRAVIKGAAPLGKVVVYDNGKRVRTFKLKKSGAKTWVVPSSLSVGTHLLRVVFKPAEPGVFKASTSRKVKLIVERA